MRHLESGPLKAALDVEALVCLAAVEDGLVAADLLGDEVEGLDEAETQLLALLVLCDGDVLDVADQAKVVDASEGSRLFISHANLKGYPEENMGRWKGEEKNPQLPLCDQRAGADDAAGVLDDQDVVAPVLPPDPLEALGELVGADVADGGQDAQAVEEAGVVVGLPQGADLVALGQGGGDVGRDQVVAEEACLCLGLCRGRAVHLFLVVVVVGGMYDFIGMWNGSCTVR